VSVREPEAVYNAGFFFFGALGLIVRCPWEEWKNLQKIIHHKSDILYRAAIAARCPMGVRGSVWPEFPL